MEPYDALQRALAGVDRSEDVKNETNPNGPWWRAARPPSFDGYYSTSWASVGLTVMALNGGKPVYEKRHINSIKEGDSLDEFIKRFDSTFASLRAIKYDHAQYKSSEANFQYAAEHGAVCIDYDGDAKVELHAVSNDPDLMAAVEKFFKENSTSSAPKGRVHVLVSTKNGPEFKSIGIGGLPLERGNYEEEVLSGYDRIVTDLSSTTPAGRVAILDGPPGTGKSFCVRGILDQVQGAIFVIVPSNLVAELAQPGMIPALVRLHQNSGNKSMVFIIEDADECLAPRMGDNMSSISVILNLGDGILGQLLDVRIIATTNAHHQDVDEAIKRPGRLSAMVHLGKLSPKRANEVYKRLTGKTAVNESGHELISSKMSLAEVYQMARDSGWVPQPKKQGMGFVVNGVDRGDVEEVDIEDAFPLG